MCICLVPITLLHMAIHVLIFKQSGMIYFFHPDQSKHGTEEVMNGNDIYIFFKAKIRKIKLKMCCLLFFTSLIPNCQYLLHWKHPNCHMKNLYVTPSFRLVYSIFWSSQKKERPLQKIMSSYVLKKRHLYLHTQRANLFMLRDY